MHGGMTGFGGVDGGHARQLRLRPAALITRRRTLIRQKLGAKAHYTPRQIRKGGLEADQRPDGQLPGVQYHRAVAAPAILTGRLGMTGRPAE